MIKKYIIFIIVVLILTFSLTFIHADEIKVNTNPEQIEIVSGESTLSVVKITSNETTGLHSIMLRLIGDYNPIVKDYTYTSNTGYISHSIEIQPDWSWIMSCSIFIVVLYCVFRFLGGLFHG